MFAANGLRFHCTLTTNQDILSTVFTILSFFSSNIEGNKIRKNATVSGDSASLSLAEYTTLLLAADNIDYKACNLDDDNVFHSMNMIAAAERNQ